MQRVWAFLSVAFMIIAVAAKDQAAGQRAFIVCLVCLALHKLYQIWEKLQ